MTRDAVNALTQAGEQKLQLSRSAPGRFFARAAMAGAFIFVGTLLSTLCAAWFYDTSLPVARLLAAVTFSAALTLIVLLGGELFTGCTLVMGVSLYDGKAGLGGTLRVWALAWVGNFAGILVLCLLLYLAGRYVTDTTDAMQAGVQRAYALAEQGDYPAARAAYAQTTRRAERDSALLALLVRRNIIDQLNQTMAVLPPCAEADSLADLEMETQRACAQIAQVRQSFFGGF